MAGSNLTGGQRGRRVQLVRELLYVIALLLPTFLIYLPAIQAEFVNWDDDVFVLSNPYIKELTWPNIRQMFSVFYMEGYYPLTLLSLAADHQIDGANPQVFHITNIVLHLLNTALVYWMVRSLTGKIWLAWLTAILFGLNTLHVESVAWVTERKDVLYTLFFLASIIAYIPYAKFGGKRHYLAALLLFLLSLLSKGQAVTLTIVLIVIDYYYDRKLLSGKVLLEKVPFFVLSLGFGIVSIFAEETEAIISSSLAFNYTFADRVAFSFYGFIQYIIMSVVPVNLAAFYPYPPKVDGSIAFTYWLYAIPVLALFLLAIFLWKRNKLVVVGIAFYTINIALLLKLIPVTDALLADRYSYVPSIGLFLVLSYLVLHVYSHIRLLRIALVVLVLSYLSWMGYNSYERTKVWQNSYTLFNDLVQKQPGIVLGWNNRGIARKSMGDLQGAIADYSTAIRINPRFGKAYLNRGIVFAALGRLEDALADFNSAVEVEPDEALNYYNRGIVLKDLGRLKEAQNDYDKAIERSEALADAWSNRGNVKIALGDYEGAIKDYNRAIMLAPEKSEYYLNRGVARLNNKDLIDAMKDMANAIRLEPGNAMYWYNRGMAKYLYQDWVGSMVDFNQAIELDSDFSEPYLYRGLANIELGYLEEGCLDLRKAGELGATGTRESIERFCQF